MDHYSGNIPDFFTIDRIYLLLSVKLKGSEKFVVTENKRRSFGIDGITFKYAPQGTGSHDR